MKKKNRLFLLAGYDRDGIIDSSLIYYINCLNKLGDVILIMDSDCDLNELDKIKSQTIYASAVRHGEYDFGSYKRAYIYAKDNNLLNKYDTLYLVNDSVYGPLFDLQNTIKKMEKLGTDAFGLVKNPHHDHPHMQSWFIGCEQSIFLSDWFDKFMHSVTKLQSKGAITRIYEHGFSKIISQNSLTWNCIYTVAGRGIYNKIKKLYNHKMPFMKKNAFPRRGGALGRQILYVLNNIQPNVRNYILENASRIYGRNYINWLLTNNPIKIIFRNIRYAARKIFIEGI